MDPSELLPTLTLGSTRGRPASAPLPVAVRGLVPADLDAIATPTPTTAPSLAKLRHVHHRVAQLLATGEKHVDVAVLTGYTPEYIHGLTKDPAFKELLAHYEADRELKFVDTLERMRALGLTALDEIQARLAEGPDEWSRRELMELAELLLIKPQQAKGAAAGAPSVAVSVKFVSARTQAGEGPGTLIEHEVTG